MPLSVLAATYPTPIDLARRRLTARIGDGHRLFGGRFDGRQFAIHLNAIRNEDGARRGSAWVMGWIEPLGTQATRLRGVVVSPASLLLFVIVSMAVVWLLALHLDEPMPAALLLCGFAVAAAALCVPLVWFANQIDMFRALLASVIDERPL